MPSSGQIGPRGHADPKRILPPDKVSFSHAWIATERPITGNPNGTSNAKARHPAFKWKQFQSSPANQKVLLQAWKITKSQADQKFLRLVQTGIEPNPGPSGHQPASNTAGAADQPKGPAQANNAKQHLTIASINVRDAPGLWRLLAILESNILVDILRILEPCLKLQEWNTVQRKFAKLHQSFYCPGKQSTMSYGGVLTAVRNFIPHKLLCKHEADDHQHMAIQIKQRLLYNSYIPPRRHLSQEGQQSLRDFMQHTEAAVGNRPWLAMGDYNQLPLEPNALFLQYDGTIVNQQSRWQNNRLIDHIWTNHPSSCTQQNVELQN